MKTTFGLLLLIAVSFSLSGQQIETTSNSANDSPAATTVNFYYTGSSQSWTVPAGVNSITIEAYGAAGGYSDDGSAGNTRPGYGARMRGTFMVTPGQILKVLVGGQGGPVTDNVSGSQGGGGGGGTFVTDNANNPLIVAGGGGGENWAQFNVNGADAAITNTGTSGGTTAGRAGAGGGFSTNGANYDVSSTGGYSFLNGGNAGAGAINAGGFGGGGGALYEGGGGGGYNGGNVINANDYSAALPVAAGSYNIGTNQSNSAVANSVAGSVAITNNAAVQGISYSGFIIPFISVSGSISAEQSFVVYGTALTNNISITAPTGFEISTTSGSGFASSLSLTQSGGTVASTTIYVRLTNSASGTPSGNIALISAGSTTMNIAVTGTVYTVPATQSSNLLFSVVMSGQATMSWTNGNGTNRIVFMKAATSGSALPVNGTTYTASANFASGTQIGSTGWYCVYNGTGSSVTVTGLTTTTYNVMVMEYNGVAGAQAYNTSSSSNNLKTFLPAVYTGSIQNYTVPAGIISITIEAYGAAGGFSDDGSGGNTRPGYGARMRGTFTVTPGQILKVLVGGQGKPVTDNPAGSSSGGGGGGGTFVTDNANNPMIVAGGGGGENWFSFNVNGADAVTSNTGTSGGTTAGRAGAGGGFSTNGANYDGSSTGGYSFLNGGNAGAGAINAGGFGGGGGALYEGGGGGGYNGGNVIPTNSYDAALPTAAGSYNNGTSQSNSAGVNSGNGSVSITCNLAQGISTSGTLTAFTSISGTASTPQSFIASGIVLTADIIVTAPTGFELCLTSGGTYSSSLTLAQTGGTVASTTLYVRMASSATGNPSGNITLTSTGATTVNIAVSGTVYSTPTTQAINITFSSTTTVSTSISWTNGNGSSRTVFMKAANTGTAAPVNGTTYAANTSFGSGAQIGSTGWYCVYNGTATSVAVTNLVANTAYITMVIEYNGVTSYQNYFTASGTNNPNTFNSSAIYSYSYTGSIQTWTVPAGITSITINASGAQGGVSSGGYSGGLGSAMQGTFTVTPGEVLSIVTGGQGTHYGSTPGTAGGGGGGSFVWHNSNTAEPMIVAGGGGGAYGTSPGANGLGSTTSTTGVSATSGSAGGSGGNGGGAPGGYGGGGGAGWKSNGITGGPPDDGGKSKPTFAGGIGNASYGGNGGFGGGAGATHGGGGGGGYSGGGGGYNSASPGGGGGSYNGGTSQTNSSAVKSGDGIVVITYPTLPIISASGIITPFAAYAGSASLNQVLSVSGAYLTGSITMTAPAEFEISTSSGSGFTNSLTFSPTNGIVSITNVYVRMTSAASGTPSGNIVLTSTPATTVNVALSGTVYATTPTQASNVNISGITISQATINWTNGNGTKRAVFVKAANTGTASPENATTYTANTIFGSGTQIGSTGWYCVYDGTGTTVTVTGMSSATSYIAMVLDYIGAAGSENYNTTTATNNPRTFSTDVINTYGYSGTIQTWTVPAGVTSVTINASGAQGGVSSGGYSGGLGSTMQGTFTVTPGEVLSIVTGGQGTHYGSTPGTAGGGGGGSFVWHNSNTTEPMIAAGGGGGAYGTSPGANGLGSTTSTTGVSATSGSAGGSGGNGGGAPGGYGGGGGAGWKSNGITGGPPEDGGKSKPTFAGGIGNASYGGNGGFGGGAGATHGGGGGGGYSGGGGGYNSASPGGGGGSYNDGTSPSNTSANRSGHGIVTITYTIASTPTISANGTLITFTSCSGTSSSEQSFTASGSDLTANITVTAPTGFELSITSGGSFSNPLTLTQTGGTVGSTTIYVRMASSATGTPSGNITLASTGATTQNVAVSGTVNTVPVVDAGDDQIVSTATATLAGSISGSASTGTWSGGAGTYSPNNATLTATYTPTAAERLAGSLILTLTSADPEGPCGSASDNVRLSFTSADKISTVDGNWETDATWSPSGAPTLIDNVTVNHTVTVNSSLAADPAICKNLAINSGKLLTVASGKALTVKGSLTNPSGATLTVASGGSLITNGSISNNGTINIQRTIMKDRWHLISSPVTDATAQVFEDDYLQSWSEVNAEWTDIISTGTALNLAQGYGLWTMYSSDHTYTFTGTPNTGNQEIPLTVSSNFPDPGTGYDGANLLGNPYPSAIDWSMLDNTYGAVYYWQGNGTNGEGTYLSWNNGTGPANGQYIAPVQGFFVVPASAGTFSLTNAHRTHSLGSYYKSASDTKDNLLVLETVSKGISDKLYVNFDTEASEDFDLQYDAYKFPSGTAGLSELYSYADDKKLSIDVRPESELVQLGFANSLSGTYSIGINQANGISKATLEDTKTNTFSDLLKGAYSFSYQAGESDQRFKLHMGTVGFEEKTVSEIAIYSYHKTAYINLMNQLKGDIYIYNMAGQLITSRETAIGLVSVDINATGIYIVKVVSDKKTTTAKIFIQ